jgi:hypothetical protein
MYGLINRSFQNFLADTYGREMWQRVHRRAGFPFADFEPMLPYDDELTDQLISAASAELKKPHESVLEDAGTYLVSHPNAESLRRLLRFGGGDFIEFLQSLDDLPERARLAVPDLDMPEIFLDEITTRNFNIEVKSCYSIFGHVLLGLLRAMADDYGALVFMEYQGRTGTTQVLTLNVLETSFSKGRSFELGTTTAPRKGDR